MLSRFDAAGDTVIFLQEQLKHVQEKVFSEQFPALRAREFIPINRTVPADKEIIVTRIWEQFGQAKIINSSADDFPAVTIGQKEAFAKVKSDEDTSI